MSTQQPSVFDYPEAQSSNFQYQYNYKDTVNVAWTSNEPNSTETTLQMFYWMPDKAPWRPLDLHVVPQNGSLSFQLNSLAVAYRQMGYYLGQWNLNFTTESGAPGLAVSQIFHCTFDDSLPQTTHSIPTATVTPSAVATAVSGAASSQVASIDKTPGAQYTSNSSPSQSGLSAGAVAGIVVGVVAMLVLGAAAMLFLLRRKYKKREAALMAAAVASDTRGGAPFPPGAPYMEISPGNGQAYPYVSKNPAIHNAVQMRHELPPSTNGTDNYSHTSELAGSRGGLELPADKPRARSWAWTS